MAKLVFLSGVSDHQMMSAVLLGENNTVVFDGGMPCDGENLLTFLRSQGVFRVDAWFFTHPHQDHIGAFLALYDVCPNLFSGRLYCNFPSMEKLETAPAHSEEERELWRRMHRLLSGPLSHRFHRLSQGDEFFFDGVKITVPWSYSPEMDFSKNFVNNSSSVFLLQGKAASVLLLGDLGKDGGEKMLSQIPPEALFADFTQMAHHGQLGLGEREYQAICPKRCIWPTPEKIWLNIGKNGPGSGPWRCEETFSWMREMGVTEHYFIKDGNVFLEV